MTKRQVRKATGDGVRISADQAYDETSPYLKEAAQKQRTDRAGEGNLACCGRKLPALGATPDSETEEGAR